MKKSYQEYKTQEIESKWQKKWVEDRIYQKYEGNKKCYILDMFPYPSGSGLHVGHLKGYIATDIISRFKRLQGYKVLHPMGWDAFGLPAENYALKNKIHPKISVAENIKVFRGQLDKMGFSYDWEREINTTNPSFYRWTQWIFLQMFKRGLAFESNEPVNWCPSCKTVLANEDLENGLCERCGSRIIQKRIRQWVLKITDYADRLLYDLEDKDFDWEEIIKEQQRSWIGRSEGVEFKMKVDRSEESIGVYTTRIDTVFGITYLVVSPEHPIVEKLRDKIINLKEVEEYLEKAKYKTEFERENLQKIKTGVRLEGIQAINPLNDEKVPVFVGDYVLASYGTGAIMAVPAHDQRDFDFATAHKLPIKQVVTDPVNQASVETGAYEPDGVLMNSAEYDGLDSQEARVKIAARMKEGGLGEIKVNYKMRDWVFSRQRYWGEPIPVVHCQKCGVVGVPESDLPVELPQVESYKPSDSEESPLAKISDWVNVQCPKCGGPAKRETNTMPQWAGSSWYYLRYIDPDNSEALIDKDKEREWMPVDLYVGGAEHATRHLLYARFWHKFLFDIGAVSTSEPFKKLMHVGLIYGEDGRKMSKRWGNVTNPNEVISQFGVDSLRVYEMFLGPFSQNVNWNSSGVIGARRFLDRIWMLQTKIAADAESDKNTKLEKSLNRLIKKITDDLWNFRFNTSISAMMIFLNETDSAGSITGSQFRRLIILLSVFAPHIAEELWQITGNTGSILSAVWPAYEEKYLAYDEVSIAVQVNGKLRFTVKMPTDSTEEEVREKVLADECLEKHLKGREIKRVVYIKNRLINFVV